MQHVLDGAEGKINSTHNKHNKLLHACMTGACHCAWMPPGAAQLHEPAHDLCKPHNDGVSCMCRDVYLSNSPQHASAWMAEDSQAYFIKHASLHIAAA